MSTSASTKASAQSFEFTKRKRWTETLFSEISETLVLVVSPTCKVLYCGSAIVELLGLKEDQLVDSDLGIFIEDEDRDNFRWSFTESLRTSQDLFMYARFKYDHPPSLDPNAKPGMLFELKGHPHSLHGQQQPHCFFLTAMPYPSRDIALLNTFLDLKIENEKLSQRIHDLKYSVEASSLTLDSSHSSHLPAVQYPQRFNQPSRPLVLNDSSLYMRGVPGFYTLPDTSVSGLRVAQKAPSSRLGDIMSPIIDLSLPGEDDSEDQRRKKMKKSLVGEEQRVCVTCGRTDSPEWRKGPHGPKTLCNACGLRWAKRTRKTEPDTGALGPKGHNCGEPGPRAPHWSSLVDTTLTSADV